MFLIENLFTIISLISALNITGTVAIIFNKPELKKILILNISAIISIISLLIFENTLEESYNKNIVNNLKEDKNISEENLINIQKDMGIKFQTWVDKNLK